VGCRMLAIRVAAVLCGALMGWSCGSPSGSSTESGSGGFVSGGFSGSSSGPITSSSSGTGMVAKLCGDPACPPLPGDDASMDDEARLDGGSEASADWEPRDRVASRWAASPTTRRAAAAAHRHQGPQRAGTTAPLMNTQSRAAAAQGLGTLTRAHEARARRSVVVTTE